MGSQLSKPLMSKYTERHKDFDEATVKWVISNKLQDPQQLRSPSWAMSVASS